MKYFGGGQGRSRRVGRGRSQMEREGATVSTKQDWLGERIPGEGAMGSSGRPKRRDTVGKEQSCRWRLFTKKNKDLAFRDKRAQESGTELNRIGLGSHWARWWLGCGLANGAETAVMTLVAAGIGLQRKHNK